MSEHGPDWTPDDSRQRAADQLRAAVETAQAAGVEVGGVDMSGVVFAVFVQHDGRTEVMGADGLDRLVAVKILRELADRTERRAISDAN